MEAITNFYDNFLIYYPNIFFPSLFFLVFLVIICVVRGLELLRKEITFIFEEIKKELKSKLKKREKQVNRRERVSFIQIIKVIFKNQKTPFLHGARIAFLRINTTRVYITSKIEKIVKKAKKEILIEK